MDHDILTRLNDSYENAKNQVLITRPLPNLNQTCAMIINVEIQRINEKGVYGSNDTNEAAAVLSNINYNNNGGFNNNACSTNTRYTGGYKSKNSFNKSTIYGEYCKYKGHTKDNCFKLHSYPSDFKKRKRGGTFNV